jgi:hypothetical protein
MIRNAARLALLGLAAAFVPACGDDETVTIIQTLPAPPGSTGSGGFGSFGGAVVPGLVFTADRNQEDVVELWSADLAGSVLVNLSGPLALGGDVGVFRWSPDRSRVAFVADKNLDGVDLCRPRRRRDPRESRRGSLRRRTLYVAGLEPRQLAAGLYDGRWRGPDRPLDRPA